jgi:hypothetical protein
VPLVVNAPIVAEKGLVLDCGGHRPKNSLSKHV